MAKTIKQQIIDLAIETLGLVRVVNDYETDIGEKVYCQTKEITDQGNRSAIFVGPETSEINKYRFAEKTMELTLEGFFETDLEFRQVNEELIRADLEVAFTDPEKPFAQSPLIAKCRYTTGGVYVVGTSSERTAQNAIIVEIVYRTKIGNPYKGEKDE